jgi:3-methyladenine DNA glycosylase Tag
VTIPRVVARASPSEVLAVIARAVFQAGVSWAQIARHWEAYERAFSGFDPAVVAHFDDADVERVLAEPGVLRSPKKVKAVIANARALTRILDEFGTFHAYASTFPDYAAVAKDVRRRFSFMGEMNAWYLLFRVGEPVPRFETWVTTIPGEHPRMREMVELARKDGISPER